LRLGERRRLVELGDVRAELEVVRRGLQACVATGTASKLSVLKEFSVMGKTGTAEVGADDQNNAWFAGYLPWSSRDGVQLCFCAVVYWVKDKTYGGEAAGQVAADLLTQLRTDRELYGRYLQPESGR
ncbi:MAG: penicillin-binding transpeptidase domain-containing protein, partial [Planctomycetota bacterium]